MKVNKEWIGKNIEFEFGKFTGQMDFQKFKAKIIDIRIDGFNCEYYQCEKPYSSLGHDFIFPQWFNAGKGKGIIKYKILD